MQEQISSSANKPGSVAAPPLSVHVVGGLSIAAPSGEVVQLSSRKAAALVAYLALDESHAASRERLAGILWSDRSEVQARASLRQNLKQLREAFAHADAGGFSADRRDIRLAATVQTDLQQALAQIRQGQRQSAIEDDDLDADRILYGYESLDHAFTSWLHVVRESWRRRIGEALEDLLRSTEAPGDARKWAAQAIVRLDPSHDEATHTLIDCLAREGNTTAALKVYAEHWKLLGDEFDMEPTERTQALVSDIKLGKFEAATAPSQPAAPVRDAPPAPQPQVTPDLPVLLVGEFAAMDGDTVEDGFARFFRRDLIANLVRFREWIVVDSATPAEGASATTALAAQGPNRSHYHIDAAFVRAEEAQRIVVTLMEIATRRYIWSEEFLLDAANRIERMRFIVRRMAVGINTHLSAALVSRYIAVPEIEPEAYSMWARAYDMIWSWQPERRREAEELFREVIRLAPRFAPAYAGIASIYNTHHAVTPGFLPSEGLVRESTEFARHAVELDPLDVRSRIALAWSNAMAGRFELARLQYDLAYELNPNNPTTLVSCANGVALCGDLTAARGLADLAIEITPTLTRFHWAYLVGVRYLCGDYAGAIAAAENSEEIIPVVRGWRAAALAMADRPDEARAAAARLVQFGRDNWKSATPATDAGIVTWFLRNFPLRDDRGRKHVEEGLKRAGLPVAR